MMGILLVLQLFPKGRPGPRWRAVVWATVITWVVVLGVGHLLTPHRIVDIWSDELSHAGASAPNPFGWIAFEGIGHLVATAGAVLGLATALLSIASLFVRGARADAVTRIQLRSLALVLGFAAGWIVVMLPVAILAQRGIPQSEDTWASALFWVVITPPSICSRTCCASWTSLTSEVWAEPPTPVGSAGAAVRPEPAGVRDSPRRGILDGARQITDPHGG